MVILVRHFPTVFNVQDRCQGWVCSEFVPHWEEIGKALTARLKMRLGSNAEIICSDLKRCVDSGSYLSNELGLPYPRTDHRLRELHYGVFEGEPYTRLSRYQPELFDEKGFYREEVQISGGESLADLQSRIFLFLRDLRTIARKRGICIVGHGGSLRMIYSILHSIPYSRVFSELKIPDGSWIDISEPLMSFVPNHSGVGSDSTVMRQVV